MATLKNDTIIIDGSVLEGGGQILRICAALSSLFCKPIQVTNIRAGRSKPGLAAQHLCGLQLVTQFCKNGRLEGGYLGSQNVHLIPSGTLSSGDYFTDVHTAGSVCLLVQAALPALLLGVSGKSCLTLRGGTDADFAPPVDYFQMCLEPLFSQICNRIAEKSVFTTKLIQRGLYPKGGGEIQVETFSVPYIPAFDWTEQGEVIGICGRVFSAGKVPQNTSEHLRNLVEKKLQCVNFISPDTFKNIIVCKEACYGGSGFGLTLTAETSTGRLLSASSRGSIGRQGKTLEQVVEDVLEMLQKDIQSGACVDCHTQDQIVVMMALAEGKSKVRCGSLTLHTQTAIHVAQQLCAARFQITDLVNKSAGILIECDGIGFRNCAMSQ